MFVLFRMKFVHLLLEFRKTFGFSSTSSQFLSAAKEEQVNAESTLQTVLFPNCGPFPSSWVHSASHPAKAGEKVLALTEIDRKLNDLSVLIMILHHCDIFKSPLSGLQVYYNLLDLHEKFVPHL